MNDTQRTVRQMADTLQNTLGDGLSLASEFREIEKAMQAAYSAGAERMREKAAQLVESSAGPFSRETEYALSIRALPVGESSRAPEGSKP